jgi:hypothetical protein
MKLSAGELVSEVGGVFDDLEHYLNETPPNLELARARVSDGIENLHKLVDAIFDENNKK